MAYQITFNVKVNQQISKNMGLKTLVLINQINNLSDARYCAGMGADILSFCLDPNEEDFLHPEVANEIIGWLAGVQVSGEFQSLSGDNINLLADSCSLQFVQLNSLYLVDELSSIKVPVILRVLINKDTIESELLEILALYQDYVHSFLIISDDFQTIDETNIRLLTDLATQFPIFIGFGIKEDTINLVLESVKPAGIALRGGEEIKPGLKNFDELEKIFEAIEE